jgi:hypothetical protein
MMIPPFEVLAQIVWKKYTAAICSINYIDDIERGMFFRNVCTGKPNYNVL